MENLASQAVWFDDLEIATGALPVAAVVQETHYDPWGLELAGIGYIADPTKESKFTYNGKEKQDQFGLGWLDYGARHYQAEIGRFTKVDRYAHKYFSLSPYHYGANNPVNFIDINGDSLHVSFDGMSSLHAFINTVTRGLKGNFSVSLSKMAHKSKNGTTVFNVSLNSNRKELSEDFKETSAGSFYSGLKGVIDNVKTTDLSMVFNDPNTHTGHFDRGTIDMADVLQFQELDHNKGVQEGPTREGKLIHEIREQYNRQVYGKNYYGAHGSSDNTYSGSALQWEDRVNRNSRSYQDVTLQNGMYGEVLQQFEQPDGRILKYSVLYNRAGWDRKGTIIVKPYNGTRGIRR